MLGNTTNENLESATGIPLFVFISFFSSGVIRDCLMLLVLCWLSSDIPVVYSDLSSSYSDELRSGCSIIEIIGIIIILLFFCCCQIVCSVHT